MLNDASYRNIANDCNSNSQSCISLTLDFPYVSCQPVRCHPAHLLCIPTVPAHGDRISFSTGWLKGRAVNSIALSEAVPVALHCNVTYFISKKCVAEKLLKQCFRNWRQQFSMVKFLLWNRYLASVV